MYLEAVQVADHEKRGISEILTVIVELIVGFLKILVLALVFPGEVVAKPDVGESLATARLAHVLLEGVVIAGGVAFSGPLFTEQLAEIEEMRLGAGVLGLREQFPA